MKRYSPAVALTLFIALCDSAQGEIYKCVAPDGHTSYAATPCPPGKGETSVQRGGPPLATPDMPRDHVKELNLRAIRNMQIPGKANARVVEDESYKRIQADRLPPPNVPSQCGATQYDSQCFDPSAGLSSFEQALRKATGESQTIPAGLPGSVRRR